VQKIGIAQQVSAYAVR